MLAAGGHRKEGTKLPFDAVVRGGAEEEETFSGQVAVGGALQLAAILQPTDVLRWATHLGSAAVWSREGSNLTPAASALGARGSTSPAFRTRLSKITGESFEGPRLAAPRLRRAHGCLTANLTAGTLAGRSARLRLLNS